MPRLNYVARDNTGRLYRGSLEADNEISLRARLKDMGFYVTEIRKETRKQLGFSWSRIRLDEVILFTERLSAMMGAGMPITRSLNSISGQMENPAFKKIVQEITLDLEGGDLLSAALSRHPKVFSNFYLNMVKTGEAGGLLDQVLQKIVEYLNKEKTLKQNIRKALTYPVIVLSAAVVVVGFLVTFIVPVFANVYDGLGIVLPLPTRILLAASAFTGSYGWMIILAAVALLIGFKKAKGTRTGRLWLDRFKLKMPIFGPLNTKVAVTRFIRTFSYLISSGVVITEALAVVKEISGNKIIENMLEDLKNKLREGRKIGDLLLADPIFPSMAAEMVATGEEAGALEKMLKISADFLDREIDHTIQKLVSRLEPLLTVSLALIIGFIAMAIYLPMFDIMGGVSKQ